jgi:hypothetical protein
MVGLSPDPNFDCERTLVGHGAFQLERNDALSCECRDSHASNTVDNADIVRDACLGQLECVKVQLRRPYASDL